MNIEFTDQIIEKEPEDKCGPRIYRCKVNNFVNFNGEIVYKTSFVPMKRMSCKKCTYCNLSEEVKEFMDNGRFINSKGKYIIDPYILCDKPEDGKLYRLAVTNITKDWESGIVDGWDLELLPYEEPKKEEKKDEKIS